MKMAGKYLLNIMSFYKFFLHIRAIATIIFVPAYIFGCSSVGEADTYASFPGDHAETALNISFPGTDTEGIVDIFTFNNDRLHKLDSYQRTSGTDIKVASTRGERILVAIANPHCRENRWAGIRSYEGLLAETALLSDDSPSSPMMTGQMTIQAGETGINKLDLSRLMSTICINSLRVDFSGTEYSGELLKGTRIYLTNVNAECRILQEERFSPGMVVNFGRFDAIAAKQFSHAEMLIQKTGDIGRSGIPGPVKLYCYPCSHTSQTAGSPFTRLVIEGSIMGHLYYYPITINRAPFGNGGIERGCRYDYDIVIRRSGTSDPDIPADTDQISVTYNITPWREMPNDTIIF